MPSSLTDLTKANFKKFYNKTKEQTSSSPSGLHLGHWKAAAKSDLISETLTKIIKIAINNAHTLKRWMVVFAVLLEKNTGKPLLHRFRTIHIIESDLNYIMRTLWGRHMMNWSE